MRRQITAPAIISLSRAVTLPALAVQSQSGAASRLIGEVSANGQQMRWLQMLSDEIGSRLTGSPGCRRAEEVMEAEMKRIGLANVHREPYTIPVSWERGSAHATLVSHGNRPLTVASYTWTPGTDGAIEGAVVQVGEGKPEDVARVKDRLRGAVALATPAGETLDKVIYNFYRSPLMAREIKDAGGIALLIASDKQHAMPYTAPIDFNARVAALPSLSIAREDVGTIQRLIVGSKTPPRMRLEVHNNLGPAFEATNIVGEIVGRERPDETVVLGAHLDSNDLGPGALDNAAGSAAIMETARAILALGAPPRRTRIGNEHTRVPGAWVRTVFGPYSRISAQNSCPITTSRLGSIAPISCGAFSMN